MTLQYKVIRIANDRQEPLRRGAPIAAPLNRFPARRDYRNGDARRIPMRRVRSAVQEADQVWLNFLRSNWTIVLAAAVLLVGAVFVGRPPAPKPPDPNARFQLIGPQGEPIVVQLPELAKVPPLDLAAACPAVAANDAAVRAKYRPEDRDSSILAAAAGCAGGPRAYAFYDELGDALAAPRESSLEDTHQTLAAMREALRAATSAKEVVATLRGLNRRAANRGDALHAPDLFLIGAEVMSVHLLYCTGNAKEAANCRADTNTQRGQDLFDAGRWRADTELLRGSIAANREALRDTEEKSDDWVELRARIGSALGQLSEQTSGDAKRALLRQALDEYELAASAVDPSSQSTWAMINQNVCSIRQPLAAMDQDRANTRRAIEECEKARVYYEKHREKTNEAAANYNMARAYEKLAAWDQDEAVALAAVDHVRRTVQLYTDDGVVMSRAFGQVHLADALIDANEFAARRSDEEGCEQSRALVAEARASLDAAEPILRAAKATGYLESLARVRRRLPRGTL
jgi:hypothetical protein